MPRSGEPHSDFPGCLWSPTLNDYACDDGYALNSGDPLPAGWERSFGSIGYGVNDTTINAGSGAAQGSSVTIKELGQVQDSQLSALIRSNGGSYITAASDPLVAYAAARWWQFSVTYSNDGSQARITENNYLLYGGLAVGAVVLLAVLSK